MKRRRLMGLLVSGLTLACCRKEELVVESSWLELEGKWEGVSGGVVKEDGGVLRIGWGEAMSAAKWTGEVLQAPFELELEARRVDGTDFFCAVTFPARGVDECVTLVIGGWGGATVGISSINDKDASENETHRLMAFETGVWYRIKLLREGERIAVWIDGEKVIDVDTTDKRLSLRPGPVSDCAPFGLATWQTTGEMRGIRWRGL